MHTSTCALQRTAPDAQQKQQMIERRSIRFEQPLKIKGVHAGIEMPQGRYL
jgi:hypothetical protein